MKKASTQINTRIIDKLLEEITTGEYKDLDRLPPELSLSEAFGVSRPTMRDALSTLEREGFISRRHGVGTLINRAVFKIKTRLDLEEEFLTIIKNEGYQPKVVFSRAEFSTANDFEADKLCIEKNDPIVRITKMISADDIPTIYCIDTFAESLIKNNDYDESELSRPIFEFLSEYCEEDVFLDLTEIHAVAADKLVSAELQIKEGEPLLHLDEVGHNFFGKPVLYSSEYYREGMITHTILRKKIN